MSSISIIGTGAMPRTIGARAGDAGHTGWTMGPAQGGPLAVVVAGDDAHGKAGVEALTESLGLRPMDVGGLKMARWREGTGLVLVGLARHAVGNIDFALGVALAG